MNNQNEMNERDQSDPIRVLWKILWTSNHKLKGGDRIGHPQPLLSYSSASYLPPTRGLGFRRCWRLNRGAYTDTTRHAMQRECQCMLHAYRSWFTLWNGMTWQIRCDSMTAFLQMIHLIQARLIVLWYHMFCFRCHPNWWYFLHPCTINCYASGR